jgi:hypothetical protein
MRISGKAIGPSPEERGMGADVLSPYQAKCVGEGLADAFSLLQAHTWVTGGGFFDAKRGAVHEARNYATGLSHTPSALQDVQVKYERSFARDMHNDPHRQGGVVVMFAKALQQQVGWAKAQDVMWELLTDPRFGNSNENWGDLAEGLHRVADAHDAKDPDLAKAVRSALETTNLDNAINS